MVVSLPDSGAHPNPGRRMETTMTMTAKGQGRSQRQARATTIGALHPLSHRLQDGARRQVS